MVGNFGQKLQDFPKLQHKYICWIILHHKKELFISFLQFHHKLKILNEKLVLPSGSVVKRVLGKNLSFKPWKWKWAWFGWKWTCKWKWNSFSHESLHVKTHLYTETRGNLVYHNDLLQDRKCKSHTSYFKNCEASTEFYEFPSQFSVLFLLFSWLALYSPAASCDPSKRSMKWCNDILAGHSAVKTANYLKQLSVYLIL